MDIHLAITRRENLRRLLNKYGSQKELARVTGLVAAHVSQIMGGKRNVGHGAAKRIEQQLELAAGWMDRSDPLPGESPMPPALTRGTHIVPRTLAEPPNLQGNAEQGAGHDEVSIDPILRKVLDQLEGHGKTYENIRLDGLVNSLFGYFRVDILVDDLAIDIFHVSGTNEQASIDRALARMVKIKHATPHLRYIVIFSPTEDNPPDRWSALSIPRLRKVLSIAIKEEGKGDFAILTSPQDDNGITHLIEVALQR
jgi:transcriptional regulator with XRE-family HTH domain